MQPERMMSDARAQAGGRGPAGPGGARYPLPPAQPFPVGGVLLIALLVGTLVGISLALLSIFEPGVLPPLTVGGA